MIQWLDSDQYSAVKREPRSRRLHGPIRPHSNYMSVSFAGTADKPYARLIEEEPLTDHQTRQP